MRGNVIEEWLREKGRKLHFTLIDPDKQKPSDAARIAETCASYGTDAIMVGGSTISRKKSEQTTIAIKDCIDLPIITFPNSANAVNEFSDYIFFMCLMNSRDRRFLIGEQFRGAPLVEKFGVHPIGMGYIIVSTSRKRTTVERIAKLDVIGENEIEKALNYALVAQYFGMHCIYLEAGSGAEKPIPNEMIMTINDKVEIPIIVGGGIRDGKTALDKVEHGADVIVTGTIAEDNIKKVKEIITAIESYEYDSSY